MDGRLVDDDDLAPEVYPEFPCEEALGDLAGAADEVAVRGGFLLPLARIVGNDDPGNGSTRTDVVECAIIDYRCLDGVIVLAEFRRQGALGVAESRKCSCPYFDAVLEFVADLLEPFECSLVHPPPSALTIKKCRLCRPDAASVAVRQMADKGSPRSLLTSHSLPPIALSFLSVLSFATNAHQGRAMSRTIVFVNQKGGVGKTTSVINLGAYLARSGKRVLLVDFDPQANLTSGVGGAEKSRKGKGAYEVISGNATMRDVIKPTAVEGLFLAPSSIDLSGATVELVDREGRDDYLKNALAPVKDEYDFVLIDCPPSLGVLTLNGLSAADEVLIPLQCEYFALEGLSLILQTIQLVQKGMNTRLKITGILFTMYDSRTRLAQDVVQQVSSYFGDRVFSTVIPRNVRLSEAPSHGVPICLYDPACIGAKSYEKLAAEVMGRG
jgi:chromosome partitioning protein